ncbi:MAG: RHS repeat protein [Acidobacteria bacterium]|nr:RHS repeat protein [Acidobacteriota bacterium]
MRRLVLMTMYAATLSAAAVKYEYDAAGRLTKADYGDGRVITYTYDKNGNLLKREATGGAGASGGAAGSKQKERPPAAKEPEGKRAAGSKS